MRALRAQARLCGRDAPALPGESIIPPISNPHPVIPAKAGIQTIEAKTAARNQVQIATSGSLLPLWEKVRMRVRRAQARLCGRDARAPKGVNLTPYK